MFLSQSMSNAGTLNIGLIGDYQSGKSLLVNCLLERPVATVGDGSATTHTIIQYRFSQTEYAEFYINGEKQRTAIVALKDLEINPDIDKINVYLKCDFLRNFVLVDMPGLDFDTSDNEKSISFFKALDYAIVVSKNVHAITNYYNVIRLLKKSDVPYYFIINCTTIYDDSRWDPFHGDNLSIAKSDSEYLEFYKPLVYPFDNEEIPIVNLMWYWLSLKDVESDELLKKYTKNFKTYGLLESTVSKTDIEDYSNFKYLKKILSMDNKMYLELRKDFKDEIQKLREELCPIGTIQAFAFPNIPVGWLACNGQSVEIAAYPELYHAIGNTFGGDGETIFALPDLRNRFVRGWDEKSTNREFGSYQEDAIQAHGHIVYSCSEEGGHKHRVGTNQWDRRYALVGDKLTHKDLVDFSSTSKDFYTNETGGHSHTITIGDPQDSINFDGRVRVSRETRPKNATLLYCIKAENLPGDEISTEQGYSTIVEKVKKELTGAAIPLSKTLPIVMIGGEEYLSNIERIKQSYFYDFHYAHQDLVFATAQCFNEICLYNARIGQRFNGFDEYGLDLLVSWIIDKELIERKDKLLFIDEVKKFMTNLSSNITPK